MIKKQPISDKMADSRGWVKIAASKHTMLFMSTPVFILGVPLRVPRRIFPKLLAYSAQFCLRMTQSQLRKLHKHQFQARKLEVPLKKTIQNYQIGGFNDRSKSHIRGMKAHIDRDVSLGGCSWVLVPMSCIELVRNRLPGPRNAMSSETISHPRELWDLS